MRGGFDELVYNYLDGLVGKLRQLRSHCEALRPMPDSVETLKLLRAEVHRIKGSGGSYGFPAISELAARIEGLLDQGLEAKALSSTALVALEELLASLEGEVQGTLQGASRPQGLVREPEAEGLQMAQARVAVVDDDPDLLRLVELQLGEAGFEVRTLQSSAETFRMLARFKPDLLVLDIEMPKPDGLELCRAIRASSTFRELPILFLTARANGKMRAAARSCGADDFLAKPFSARQLIDRILACLTLRRTEQ
jgi:CheY-like chemotaxis protein